MSSGADLVADISGFDEEIRDATILVTGEGRTDEQTAGGELCAILAARARQAGAGTILISGALHGDSRNSTVFSTRSLPRFRCVFAEEAIERLREIYRKRQTSRADPGSGPGFAGVE